MQICFVRLSVYRIYNTDITLCTDKETIKTFNVMGVRQTNRNVLELSTTHYMLTQSVPIDSVWIHSSINDSYNLSVTNTNKTYFM